MRHTTKRVTVAAEAAGIAVTATRALRRSPWLVLTMLLLVSCATAPAAPRAVNITGTWTGTFEGSLFGAARSGAAEAEFNQTGGTGTGRMRFEHGAGSAFQPVTITVAGTQVIAEHANGGRYLTVVFSVRGDTMSGTITSSAAPVTLTLKRVR